MAVLENLLVKVIFESDLKALNRIEDRLQNFATNARKIGKGMSLVGTAMGTGIGLAGKVFGEYEENVAEIKGLVGVTEAQLKMAEEGIKQTAIETGLSLKEISRAMFFVQSAGARGAEANEILLQSAKAARAGLGETKAVALLVTSAVNVFREDALTATEAVDQLTNAVRMGNLEAAYMATALPRALAMAQGAGISFKEIVDSVAGLSRAGFTPQIATTSIEAMIRSFVKPQKASMDLLASYGIDHTMLRKMIRDEGLHTTISFMYDLIEGSITKLNQLFTDETATRGVQVMVGGLRPLFKQLAEISAKGVGEEAFQAKQGTLQDTYLRLTNAFLAFASAIGESAKPALIAILTPLSNLLGFLAKTLGSINILGTSLVILTGLVAGVGYGLYAASFAVEGYLKAVAGYNWLMANSKVRTVALTIANFAHTASMKVATLQTLAYAKAQALANKFMAMHPAGQIAIVVAVLAAAVFALWRNWESVVSSLKAGLPDWLRTFLGMDKKKIEMSVASQLDETNLHIDMLKAAIDQGRFSGEDLAHATKTLALLTREQNRLQKLALEDLVKSREHAAEMKTAKDNYENQIRLMQEAIKSRDAWRAEAESFPEGSYDRSLAEKAIEEEKAKIVSLIRNMPHALKGYATYMAGVDATESEIMEAVRLLERRDFRYNRDAPDQAPMWAQKGVLSIGPEEWSNRISSAFLSSALSTWVPVLLDETRKKAPPSQEIVVNVNMDNSREFFNEGFAEFGRVVGSEVGRAVSGAR